MLRLAIDADVNGAVVRGLLRRAPHLDLVRVQDALPQGTPDPQVLDWAAREERVLVTNDRNTMIAFALQRAVDAMVIVPMIATTNTQSVGSAIEDILFIAAHMEPHEIREQLVVYLPFS